MIYSTLLIFHSIVRWLVVIGWVYSLLRSIIGVVSNEKFNKLDNFSRSFTSAITHVQLILGLVLYVKSPLIATLRSNFSENVRYVEMAYFGIFHISLMIIAIVLVTIGAAKAKRAETDRAKHKQILIWFGIAMVLIFLAIPWPFNPYAARPYFRVF